LIPDGTFPLLNPSGYTKAWGSTEPLTEMGIWNIFWRVKVAAWKVLKCGAGGGCKRSVGLIV